MAGEAGPPPWWPDGEAWPPEDWRMARRQFVPRIAGLMLGLILLVLTSCVLVFALYWNIWRQRRPGRRQWVVVPIGGVIVLGLLVYAGTRGFRSLRTNALALDEVVRGVDQIAAGTYDITLPQRGWPETRDLSRSVMTMAARLRAAEQQRTAMQADIAHELRTPLSVIQGTTEGMLDGVYRRDDEHLELILRRSRMMASLLEDFRTISTADAGALVLQRETVDIGALLDRTVADFQDEAIRLGVALDRTGDAALDAEVDPHRIGEVLDNLIENALRHTRPGDRIELGCGTTDGAVRLWVRDTGEGIPADRLPFVFERFTKSADSDGSGLGLAIARRLVEAHGGAIEVESAEGVGTVFTIDLPAE